MKKIYLNIFLILTILPINQIYTQNLNWEPVSWNINNNIIQMEPINHHDVVIRSAQGIYIVHDFETFLRIDTLFDNHVEVSIMTVSPDSVLYVGTNKGVFSFNQQDLRWKDENYNLVEKNIVNLAISNNNEMTIFVLLNTNYTDNVEVSYRQLIDTNWVKLKQKIQNKFNYLQYGDNGELLGIQESKIFKREISVDNNYEFILADKILNQLPIGIYNGFAFKDENLYLLINNFGICTSNDTGKTFNMNFEGLPLLGSFSKIMLTQNGEILISSRVAGMFYSNDGGANFEMNNEGLSKKKINTFTILNDGRIVICDSMNTLFISDAPKNIPIKQIGWKQDDDFLSKQATQSSINFIKISNDGKSIFVISNNILKIFDFESGTLKKSKTFPLKYFINAVVSDDDESVIAIYLENPLILPSLVRTEIYDIENFELNWFFEFKIGDNPGNIGSILILNSQPKFITAENKLYLNFSYEINTSATGYITKTSGKTYKVIFKEDSTEYKLLWTGVIANYILTDDGEIIFSTHDYDSYWYNSKASYGGGTSQLIMSKDDLATHQILYSNKYGYNNGPSNNPNFKPFGKIDFIKSNNELVCNSYYNLFSYNFKTNDLSDLTSFQKLIGNYEPFSYIFNNFKNRILLGSSNGIYIFSYPQFEQKFHKLFPYNTNYKWVFSITPDTSGFVAGRSDGLMMLFKSFYISDVEDNRSNNGDDKFNLFPNPANEFIIVNDTDISKIVITNINGVEINSNVNYSNDKATIQISDLNAGIYFIRIFKDKSSYIRKFVRIE